MTTLLSAINANSTVTENGMATFESSLSNTVDLFFKFGGSRGRFDSIREVLAKAIVEDMDRTVRILLWGRDARSGAGERQLFRDAVTYFAKAGVLSKDDLIRIANQVPVLGRWDDLFAFFDTEAEAYVMGMLKKAVLVDRNGLAAKWLPRKGSLSVKIRNAWGMTPKQYRKTLVNLTNVVETPMCDKAWQTIDFEKVPSLAAARYQKAFLRNAPDAYAVYKSNLVAGTAKINASAVYPYDITKSIGYGDSTVASEQWKALPNYCEGLEGKILPVVDVSGSMTAPAGNNATVTCMDVAVSLGLYLSERLRGPFQDAFITFTSKPQLQIVKGNLRDRMLQMIRSDWGMDTNLHAVFDLILNSAVRGKVSQDDMPETILILSDMQFIHCIYTHNDNAIGMIERKYQEAGYKIPNVIFWNLRTSNGVPVTFDKNGTALVSGFSPSIMKSILKADNLSPVSVMDSTIMNPQYDW